MSTPADAKSEAAPSTREARARARRRRQTYTFLSLFLAVVLIGIAALGNWEQWWTIGGETQAVSADCPTTSFPAPDQIEVNVYNGTARRGLASAVGAELTRRGFDVTTVANQVDARSARSVALIRYGSSGLASAHTVALEFPGKVTLAKDRRTTGSVDVVVGAQYRLMVTREKAAAAVKVKTAPKGCATG